MSTIQELEIILHRLQRCPLNLVRIELETFHKILEQDTVLFSILQNVLKREEQVLGQKAPNLVYSLQESRWHGLEFADTAARRAAVGYQVCVSLLSRYEGWESLGKQAVKLGKFYELYYGPRPGYSQWENVEAIKTLSEVFLQPLADFLRAGLEIEDKILYLLSRYRQRSEWFADQDEIESQVKRGGDLEDRLKKDLLRYLFDNGIDFTIEAQEPSGGGRVDILPVLPDGKQLPIEVKVFDGASRNTSYVSKGLSQTADYGRKFSSPIAYYFVYNIAENTKVWICGTQSGHNVVKTTVSGIDGYSAVANLKVTLPPSSASKLKLVEIPVSTLP